MGKSRVRLPQVPRSRGRSKYGAIRTTIDGVMFHSKKEAQRYAELKLLERAGEISDLTCQPRFPLRVRADEAPVTQIIGDYVADFRYDEAHDGEPS